MKLADKYLPPLPDGEYTVYVTQDVETEPAVRMDASESVGERYAGKKESFEARTEFDIISRGFTLLQDDVFSVYPAEHMQGDFQGEVPFLVSGARTLPWMYGDGRLPWVALIVIGEEDAGVSETDIPIEELLSGKTESLYFPASAMPSKYVEKKEDCCHILDIPLVLFREIMPKKAETEYLCHSEYTPLADTEEQVSGMDGFFSVVIGNRFIPPGKAAVHLVSVLGYPDYGSSEYEGYDKVRLVSLYHWGVCCEPQERVDFRRVMEQLDSGMFQGNRKNRLSEAGVCAKEHYTRSGDRTGSLYHSPLVPYKPEDIPQVMEPGCSADSLLVYDKESGVFDVTYAAAWQYGRMAALSEDGTAQKVADCRNQIQRNFRKEAAENMAYRMEPDYGETCVKLAGIWSGRERKTK